MENVTSRVEKELVLAEILIEWYPEFIKSAAIKGNEVLMTVQEGDVKGIAVFNVAEHLYSVICAIQPHIDYIDGIWYVKCIYGVGSQPELTDAILNAVVDAR